jgi:cytochrome b subunit of formate dehydrogenase
MPRRTAEDDPDRGPSDYEQDAEQIKDLIRRTVRATISVRGDYNEGGPWSKWIMPGLVTLTVTGIIGGVVMFGKLSSMEAQMQALKEQVDRVEKIVEPRYRSG